MRILHVIGDLAPQSGGPAKAGFEMARAVARRGHEVAIYATDFGQPPELPRDRLSEHDESNIHDRNGGQA